MEPEELRRRASRYRDLARTTVDARIAEALYELADEYEVAAINTRTDAGAEDEDDDERLPPAR
jgi:hypothetical protein